MLPEHTDASHWDGWQAGCDKDREMDSHADGPTVCGWLIDTGTLSSKRVAG